MESVLTGETVRFNVRRQRVSSLISGKIQSNYTGSLELLHQLCGEHALRFGEVPKGAQYESSFDSCLAGHLLSCAIDSFYHFLGREPFTQMQ